MKHNNEFDYLLDDALAEYREAEPLAGLEDRTLRHVRLGADHRRKLLWRWSVLAATAALALAIWIGIAARMQHEPVPAAVAQKERPAAEPQRKAPESIATRHANVNSRAVVKLAHSRQSHGPRPSQLATSQREPMRQQFPMLAPLTSGERALLALAQTHPAALQELPQDDSDAEIAIAPITIKPLAENDGGTQGEE